ncbi:hypothetical protein BCPG1_109 [Bacillus phage BCPG1]|nr:hypothetical protein BCPG1_109 [Bacillus phage BCPG1]
MFEKETDEELIELRQHYLRAFNDNSPWAINKNHFFKCFQAVDAEITKRGVLVNEED